MTTATGSTSPRSVAAPTPRRLDRRVLHANLISGAALLVPTTLLVLDGAWMLLLLGGAYIGVASLILAAAYGRENLSHTREVVAWATPWLLAVALWAALLTSIEMANGSTGLYPVTAPGAALVVATPSYLLWQTAALAVRQLLAWRTASTPEVATP